MNATTNLAFRNTLRRRVRTALTAGMVVAAVALLLLALSWIEGVMGGALKTATASGGHVRIVEAEYAAREELNPLDAYLEAPDALAKALRGREGVVAVEPRITTGVTVTVGEELGDVFAQAVGANDSYFRSQLHAHEKLAKGGWFTGAPDELVLGARVAEQAEAKVGDEVLLLGMTQDGSMSPIKGKLVGILKKGSGALDQQVLAPLGKLQWMTDIAAGATELLVFAHDHEQGPALAQSLRSLPELRGHQVQSWAEREPWKSLGDSVKGMRGIIVFVVVFLAALGIWNTMMMSVLERTHEVGVLRAMGLSRAGAVRLFLVEASAIGLVGGLLGVALGAVPAWLLETKGVHIGDNIAQNMQGMSERVYGDLSLEGALTAFALGVLMAVLGSVVPALRAASIQPVSAMRSGR